MSYAVGVIGYGAIGRDLLQAIDGGLAGDATTCPAVLVRRPRNGDDVPPQVTAEADEFFAHRFDAVVECAGHGGLREHGEAALHGGADLLVTSVGALTDDALLDDLRRAATAHGRKLILPSAGIGGLDTLAAAAVGGLDRVVIEVRKAPVAWQGTPGEDLVDLDSLSEAAVLYDGPVREGARLYPANVNISAAVAFAGLGLDRTQVRIIADPAITTHVVTVEAEGVFGRMRFMEDVLPSPDNPKTGRIVAMALVKTVRQLASNFVVGA